MSQNATADIIPNYSTGTSKISMLNKYVLISKIVEEEVSKSGLALSTADIQEIRYRKAIVISVGASVTPNTIKEKDVILYDRVAGHQIRIDNETYTIIQEKDVVVCLPS